MSDSAAPEFASFHELEQLVHSLGEELAGFRKRALTAESRLKAFEAASGPTDLFSHERLAAIEQENAELRRRLASATERTNQVVAQLRSATAARAYRRSMSEKRSSVKVTIVGQELTIEAMRRRSTASPHTSIGRFAPS